MTRKLVRRLAYSLAGLVFFVTLSAGGCVLFARHALNHGALAIQPWGCLRARDHRDDPTLIDRALTVQIQRWTKRSHTATALDWHASGLIALLGLRLGYSQSDRQTLAAPMLATTPSCLPRTQHI